MYGLGRTCAGRIARNGLALVVYVCTVNASVIAQTDEVYIRVIDVGPGLACIVKLPDNHYMVYDAGHWNTDSLVQEVAHELIPEDEEIDLMVLSHSDSDHLGAADEILDDYDVLRVIRSGLNRSTGTWGDADRAIKKEVDAGICTEINLMWAEFPPGATYRFGDAFVTFVCGWGEPSDDWNLINQGERRNAGSIVIRIVYGEHSVLFCGDAVGRHIGRPDNECIATENAMIEMSPVVPIDSDILIAPHHGADNGSSSKFIKAVSPEFVIFSAGHDHNHPTQAAADRYLANGVALAKMFRTDLGDDERKPGDPDFEWTHGRVAGHSDKTRDGDDIEIILRIGEDPIVRYVSDGGG